MTSVSGTIYCPVCMKIVYDEDVEFVEDIGHCKSCEAALSDEH